MTDFNELLCNFPNKKELDDSESRVKKNILFRIKNRKTSFVFIFSRQAIISFIFSCFLGILAGTWTNFVNGNEECIYDNGDESISVNEDEFPSILVYDNIMENLYE